MSKYKKVMLQRGIMQKEVLTAVQHVDERVDKSLLSKIVNDVCLPTPRALDAICTTLACEVGDLYEPQEITLAPTPTQVVNNDGSVCAATQRTRDRRQNNDFYNLTAEIPRDLADRVLIRPVLQKMGYKSVRDFVQHAVEWLDREYTKKKAAADTTSRDG